MNERIKALIELSIIKGEEYLPGNDGHPTPTFYFDKQKFAELIIQECIRIGSISFQNDNSIVPVFPSKQIKDHFEV